MELLNDYKCLAESSIRSRWNDKPPESASLKATRPVDHHDFHQMVSLMCLSGPIKGATKQRPIPTSPEQATEIKWHRFLDNLAWLADNRTGGSSVTAISAQIELPANEDFLIYHVAGNNKVSAETINHLSMVLSSLQNICRVGTNNQYFKQKEALTRRCIDFSRPKACNYLASLTATIRNLTTSGIKMTSSSELSLLRQLERLMLPCEEIMQACSTANKFRLSKMTLDIDHEFHQDEAKTYLKAVKHFIGRLSSWHKSIEILIYLTQKEPCFAGDFRFQAVSYTPGVASHLISATNLDGALRRHYPGIPNSQLRELLGHRLKKHYSGIDKAFAHHSRAQTMSRTSLHAEMLILEHIGKSDNFTFAFNSRYIGCSKRSCYLCDLYIRLHSLSLHGRPCHGRIYSNWRCPSGISSVDKDVGEVLQVMVDYMRQDFIDQISIEISDSDQGFDSTTGLSSSCRS